ncbi:hypothetical protein [Methanotorris igneus]|nr:hypothetical protein [Methanotorris igneus]
MGGIFVLSILSILILGIIFIALIIAGIFLYFGCKLANIEDVSLGKAIVAVVGGGILSFIVSSIFSAVPVIGGILSFVFGILSYVWVIKVIFNTNWSKAFLAWLMAIVVEVVVMFIIAFIIAFIFGVGILSLMHL